MKYADLPFWARKEDSVCEFHVSTNSAILAGGVIPKESPKISRRIQGIELIGIVVTLLDIKITNYFLQQEIIVALLL